MYYAAIRQMSQMLTNLGTYLDHGAERAEAKGYPVGHLLAARLAPDMYNLTRQVQAASDAAKYAAARLAGKDAPAFEDTETTFEELKHRIGKTIDFLGGFSEGDFAGAGERHVQLSYLPAPMTGQNYLIQLAQPNFYFHVCMAYAILRKNGVDLGKQVFIGHVDLIQG